MSFTDRIYHKKNIEIRDEDEIHSLMIQAYVASKKRGHEVSVLLGILIRAKRS